MNNSHVHIAPVHQILLRLQNQEREIQCNENKDGDGE